MTIAKAGLFAALAIALPAASAATYDIRGSFSIDQNSYLTNYPYITLETIITPASPTFQGDWAIDLDAMTLSGQMLTEPFTSQIKVFLNGELWGKSSSAISDQIGSIDGSGANHQFDELTHVLTITAATVTYTSHVACLEEEGNYRCGTDDPPATIPIDLVLTFNKDFSAFTGAGSATNDTSAPTIYTFTGTQVPPPASAWLFGSGLLALSGIRRKRATAPC